MHASAHPSSSSGTHRPSALSFCSNDIHPPRHLHRCCHGRRCRSCDHLLQCHRDHHCSCHGHGHARAPRLSPDDSTLVESVFPDLATLRQEDIGTTSSSSVRFSLITDSLSPWFIFSSTSLSRPIKSSSGTSTRSSKVSIEAAI
jgi:hypothetical protein